MILSNILTGDNNSSHYVIAYLHYLRATFTKWQAGGRLFDTHWMYLCIFCAIAHLGLDLRAMHEALWVLFNTWAKAIGEYGAAARSTLNTLDRRRRENFLTPCLLDNSQLDPYQLMQH